MANHTVGGLIDNQNAEAAASALGGSVPESPAITDIASLPTDAINPGLVSGAMPSEPICPKIPGITFPKLPKIPDKDAALGDKFKNPPSPTDTMNKLANKGSTAAGKLAKALEKAARDTAAQVEDNLAAEFDKLSDGFTDLEAAMEAVKSGAIDLGSLGMDVLSLPGDALAAFPGFKSAAECLKGAPGSAEEAFNKTAPELDAGVSEGRGQDGATAALAVTEKSEVVVNETGEEVSKQEVLTEEKRDAILKAQQELTPKKPITAKPVPVSVNALSTERDKAKYSEYMTLVGLSISGNEFMTNNGRALTAAEQTRYDAGLPPLFVSGIIQLFKFRREPPGKITIAIAQSEFDKSHYLSESQAESALEQAERRRKGLVEMQEVWAAVDGRAIPSAAYVPYSADEGPPPHYGWRKFGAWHPLSYDVQSGPPPEFDPDTKEPFLSQGVPIYDSYGFLYEKTEEYNTEENSTWDQRWIYSRIGGSLSVQAPSSFREFS